jgi:hypothetical protein
LSHAAFIVGVMAFISDIVTELACTPTFVAAAMSRKHERRLPASARMAICRRES